MQVKAYLSMIGVLTLLIGCGVILSLVATSPARLGPIGVTVWFIGLLATSAGALTLLLYALKSFLKIQENSRSRLIASWRQGLMISGGLTVLLALGSLRQLSLRDVVIIAIMLALVEFYFRTRR